MTLFARYSFHGEINYGILEGSEIQTISSAPYNEYKLTGEKKKLMPKVRGNCFEGFLTNLFPIYRS